MTVPPFITVIALNEFIALLNRSPTLGSAKIRQTTEPLSPLLDPRSLSIYLNKGGAPLALQLVLGTTTIHCVADWQCAFPAFWSLDLKQSPFLYINFIINTL